MLVVNTQVSKNKNHISKALHLPKLDFRNNVTSIGTSKLFNVSQTMTNAKKIYQ